METAVIFWSTSSVDLRWPRVGLPLIFMAEWRLLRALALVAAWCYLIYYLLADVPFWRPLISFDAGNHAGITPSGLVPGGDRKSTRLNSSHPV